MLQNYPKAQDNTTIKWKKLILEACLGVFVPFCSFFEHFWGPKSKNIRFFAGIDLEWHETHFEMKISRKRSFLVQILSSCNLQKVSFMAADLFTCSFYAERSLQFHPLSRKPPLGSTRPEVNRQLFCLYGRNNFLGKFWVILGQLGYRNELRYPNRVNLFD